MEHKIIKTILIAAFLAFFISGCYYDNEDQLYPYYEENCDINNVSYSLNVKPVLEQSCVSCHNASNPSGGVALDTYDDVKTVATNGRLKGSINHENGYAAMPQGGSISSCSIAQINAWIDGGSLDN